MKSGGYKVIDLARKPLSNFATVYSGIYEQIESTNKLCVVSGLYAGGTEYDDVAVLFTGGKVLSAKVSDTITLKVSDTDEVTVDVKVELPAIFRFDATNYELNTPVTDIESAREIVNAVISGVPVAMEGFPEGSDLLGAMHMPTYQGAISTFHSYIYYDKFILDANYNARTITIRGRN